MKGVCSKSRSSFPAVNRNGTVFLGLSSDNRRTIFASTRPFDPGFRGPREIERSEWFGKATRGEYRSAVLYTTFRARLECDGRIECCCRRILVRIARLLAFQDRMQSLCADPFSCQFTWELPCSHVPQRRNCPSSRPCFPFISRCATCTSQIGCQGIGRGTSQPEQDDALVVAFDQFPRPGCRCGPELACVAFFSGIKFWTICRLGFGSVDPGLVVCGR